MPHACHGHSRTVKLPLSPNHPGLSPPQTAPPSPPPPPPLQIPGSPLTARIVSQLKAVFAAYGSVVDVFYASRKCFAFVEFASDAEANSARAATQQAPPTLDSRVLFVSRAAARGSYVSPDTPPLLLAPLPVLPPLHAPLHVLPHPRTHGAPLPSSWAALLSPPTYGALLPSPAEEGAFPQLVLRPTPTAVHAAVLTAAPTATPIATPIAAPLAALSAAPLAAPSAAPSAHASPTLSSDAECEGATPRPLLSDDAFAAGAFYDAFPRCASPPSPPPGRAWSPPPGRAEAGSSCDSTTLLQLLASARCGDSDVAYSFDSGGRVLVPGEVTVALSTLLNHAPSAHALPTLTDATAGSLSNALSAWGGGEPAPPLTFFPKQQLGQPTIESPLQCWAPPLDGTGFTPPQRPRFLSPQPQHYFPLWGGPHSGSQQRGPDTLLDDVLGGFGIDAQQQVGQSVDMREVCPC